MSEDRKVKDIMIPIEEYNVVKEDAQLCDALSILKKHHEDAKAGRKGSLHKTVFVQDARGNLVGKISVYDLIRGLVPEDSKNPELSRAFYSVLSSRALEVATDIGEVQERFQWLHTTFFDLVKQEAHKKVKDIMSPLRPLLKEEDTINQAIYIMFKEHIRQPQVVRGGKIIGVVDFMGIFDELIEIVGPECHVIW